jgi:hypothetical protein
MVSHTTTGEWQSFEGRMRRRRAERLALRADVAADAGCLDEAREAFGEARKLWPSLPDLDRIARKLERKIEPPVEPPPVVDLPLVLPLVEAPTVPPLAPDLPLRDGQEPATHGRTIWITAAALALIATGGAAARHYGLSREQPLQPTEEFRDAVREIAPPPAHAPTAPSPEIPAEAQPVSTTGSLERDTPRAPESPRERDAAPPERVLPASLSTLGGVPSSTPAPIPPPAPAAESAPVPAPPLERVVAREPVAAPPPVIATDTLTATPGVASAPPEPVVSQDALVRSTLDRYAAAYSDLDADAAQRVWPAVNRSALSRAFDSLASQRVSLGTCTIDVAGATAHARCAGSTTWRPKVGNDEMKTDRRTWTFDLAKAAGGWQIVNARVQNR